MKTKKELKKLARTIVSIELELQKQEDVDKLTEIENLVNSLSFEDFIELDNMVTTMLENQ